MNILIVEWYIDLNIGTSDSKSSRKKQLIFAITNCSEINYCTHKYYFIWNTLKIASLLTVHSKKRNAILTENLKSFFRNNEIIFKFRYLH